MDERAARDGETVGEGKARQGAHVSQMQRRRLLSAFVEVLCEHGYEDATVARICKRAGVSRRTFYDLFDDREDCFIDAFYLATERLSALVVAAHEPEAPALRRYGAQRTESWRVRVRASLVALLGFFEAEPGLARMCLVETLKGGPKMLERRQAIVEMLTAAIDEGRLEARGSDPPPLTAESLVGGAVSVIHTRVVNKSDRSLLELVNPLMSMIVLPYFGPAAARKELDRPALVSRLWPTGANHRAPTPASDPFRDLPIRITFRTVRVLSTIASEPDASNREIGQSSGVTDQGQMSKLLRRLEDAGLIENHGEGQSRGEPNAWRLTEHGHDVLHAVGGDGVQEA